jgi:uncharacterized protein (TIGR02996 family)
MSQDRLRQVLADALAANPGDLAAHSAYADYLQEQGDPRGEFVQVQLALEDPSRAAQDRAALQVRERELLRAHENDWLGELAPAMDPAGISDWRLRNDKFNRAGWARGWLDDLYLWQLDVPLARLLARAPQLRLLRRLHIDLSGYDNDYQAQPEDGIPEGSEYPTLYPLARAGFWPNLRVFQLGESVDFERGSYNCTTSGEGAAGLLGRATRLEELHLLAHSTVLRSVFALANLTNLRVLVAYHHDEYPLEVLAANPALGRLTTLRLHPRHNFPGEPVYLPRDAVRDLLRSPHLPALTHLHLHGSDLGDGGCRDIVQSGILSRLKVLDLAHGCITDEGARTLAACPDLRRLELLSLEHNELTNAGREVLGSLGIAVRCGPQNEPGSDEYLWSGDME